MPAKARLRAILTIAAFAAVVTLIVLMGVYAIPFALPVLPLGQYEDIIRVVLILLATKLVLELVKPAFKMAMAKRIPHEAEDRKSVV